MKTFTTIFKSTFFSLITVKTPDSKSEATQLQQKRRQDAAIWTIPSGKQKKNKRNNPSTKQQGVVAEMIILCGSKEEEM